MSYDYLSYDDRIDFSSVIGKIFTEWLPGVQLGAFKCDDGKIYAFHHQQDCCEGVGLEELVGDVSDMLNTPILQAEASTNSEDPPQHDYVESFTWTFYKMATIKGYVTFRFLGESNGYYGEEVDFYCLDGKNV